MRRAPFKAPGSCGISWREQNALQDSSCSISRGWWWEAWGGPMPWDLTLSSHSVLDFCVQTM